MTKKYLCIGDLHGKVELVEKLLSDEYKDYHKVFVGDYVDSYHRSFEDQIQTIDLLLDAAYARSDVTCLIGNHELSYIKRGMSCSGKRNETSYVMHHLKESIYQLFKTHLYITEDLLVTHAGASGKVFSSKEDLKQKLEEDDPALYRIGRSRGGWAKAGGIFWCDFWEDFTPIENLIQICGHTRSRPNAEEGVVGIVEMDNCYNLDCLDSVPEVLEVTIAEVAVHPHPVHTFRILNLDTHKPEEVENE